MLALFAVGCAGPEAKLGRGIDNTFEIVRGGEMNRTMEQTALFDSPDEAYTVGFIRGFDRTMARTGLGLYEILTFPIPNGDDNNYAPLATHYLNPTPVYPTSYTPKLIGAYSAFEDDAVAGFSGGDVAPWFPGSRFRIFDN